MKSGNQRKEPNSIHRRVFIGRVAKKAAYVAPAVLALQAASKAKAGVSACGETGSPCAVDGDCCGGFLCEAMGGGPCTGGPQCKCTLP